MSSTDIIFDEDIEEILKKEMAKPEMMKIVKDPYPKTEELADCISNKIDRLSKNAVKLLTYKNN